MPVSDKHPQYLQHVKQWELVRDCVKGSEAVKAAKTKYLPKPNPLDYSDENTQRYNAYRERANFVNFTALTLNGLVGMVFRDDVNISLQPDLEYLTDNATGDGVPLDQLARRATIEALTAGRLGLLVDYPEAPEGLTRRQTDPLKATIVGYPAESIINWRQQNIDGVVKTVLVVLWEQKEVIHADGFGSDFETQYRVLRLDEGTYYVEIYDKDGMLVEITQPRRSNGQPWDEIPFVFCGSENNDTAVDKSPLYDIAEVNIAHYRNSADFEESAFLVGQPTPWVSGVHETWVTDIMKGGFHLGSRAAILLPEGGSAGLLQANSNQMPQEGMRAKEEQLLKIGARIIQEVNGNETMDAAAMRHGAQTSPLATLVGNVEAAFQKCIEWAGEFMSTPGENEFDINREFFDKHIDAQTITAQIMLLDRGVIAMPDLRQNLRNSGVLENDRTDDEIDSEAETESPINPGVVVP